MLWVTWKSRKASVPSFSCSVVDLMWALSTYYVLVELLQLILSMWSDEGVIPKSAEPETRQSQWYACKEVSLDASCKGHGCTF